MRFVLCLLCLLVFLSPCALAKSDTGLLRFMFPCKAKPLLGPFLAVGLAGIATDQRSLRGFDTDPSERRSDPFFRVGNLVGDGRVLALALIGLYSSPRASGRTDASLSGAALVNAAVATAALKAITGRERPYQAEGRGRWHGPRWGDMSFPSGHTAASVAVAHVLSREHPRQRWLWYGLAAGVAVSRVSSRQHWLSDVWFGGGVGVLAAEGALAQRAAVLGWRF